MTRNREAEHNSEKANAWTVANGQAARWIALHLDLRAPRTWFGPSWALLGGIVSSGRFNLDVSSLVFLAVAWLVAEPLLGELVALSFEIAHVRRINPAGFLMPNYWTMPYGQPGSPGQRMLDSLAGLAMRFRRNWRAIDGAGERWSFLALFSLVLGAVAGAVAGGWTVLLVALALPGLAVLAVKKPLRSEGREIVATVHFFLAWLIGRSAFAAPDYAAFLVGAGYAAIWYAWTRRPPLPHLLAATHVLLAGLLAALPSLAPLPSPIAPIAAGGILLLAVPLLVLWPEGPSGQRVYLPQTQIFLMASLLLAAWSLALCF